MFPATVYDAQAAIERIVGKASVAYARAFLIRHGETAVGIREGVEFRLSLIHI